MPTSVQVGEVSLRTPRTVYREATRYRLDSLDRRGNPHASFLPAGAVATVHERWNGKTLDVDLACQDIEPLAVDLELPYTYGHKLRYCVQDLLIVLAAEGAALIAQEGRKYVYRVVPAELTPAPAQEGDERPAGQALIANLLLGGENKHVEFKASAVYDHRTNEPTKERMLDILRTIAGFLNAEGGTLLVGVRDDSVVAGLHHDYTAKDLAEARDKWLLNLRTAIQNHIGHDQWGKINARIAEVNGLDVGIVEVRPATKPAYVTWRNQQSFYVRAINSTQTMPASAMVDYIKDRF